MGIIYLLIGVQSCTPRLLYIGLRQVRRPPIVVADYTDIYFTKLLNPTLVTTDGLAIFLSRRSGGIHSTVTTELNT